MLLPRFNYKIYKQNYNKITQTSSTPTKNYKTSNRCKSLVNTKERGTLDTNMHMTIVSNVHTYKHNNHKGGLAICILNLQYAFQYPHLEH